MQTNPDDLDRFSKDYPFLDALKRHLENRDRRQDLQAWVQMLVSLILGWILGQITLHNIIGSFGR